MTLSKERKDYLTKIADQITFELCRDLKVDEWTREQKQNFKKIIIKAEKNLWKKKYKLYKLQPFNFDYKIVDISKEEYKRLKKEYERDLKK